LMNMFLGNSEQWEELLEQERLAALNDTDVNGEDLKTALNHIVNACVGSHCNDDLNSVQLSDEF